MNFCDPALAEIGQPDFLGATIERTYTMNVKDPDRLAQPLRVLGWQYRLPARFVFTGKGYGHGVGMSQWGAQGMALEITTPGGA